MGVLGLGVPDGTPISVTDILLIQHPQSEEVDIYYALQMRNPYNKGLIAVIQCNVGVI